MLIDAEVPECGASPMTREIADPPHPTPNPDGPHAAGEGDETKPVPAGVPREGEALQEEPYDSFFDDVNKMLSQSIEQPAPDPVLGSRTGDDAPSRRSRPDDPVARLIRGDKQSPRTSEVFKAVVAMRAGGAEAASPGAPGPAGFSGGDSPEPETAAAAAAASPLLPDLVVGRREAGTEMTSDDEIREDARFPWFQVFILSYASAVTLALSWMVLTGRSSRPADPATTVSTEASETASPTVPSPSLLDAKTLPPVPPENTTTLRAPDDGDAPAPLRIGDLQVTPVSVALARVELEGSIDPSKYKEEASESLVLRLRFTNLSKSQAFAPLELAYIREQASRLDRCFITTSDGKSIGAYPLAVDSEWSIVGQESVVLDPGRSFETVIASEPGVANRLSSEMMWRVRLRIGSYRTDVIGVRFRSADVERDPAVCQSALRPLSRTACLGFALSGF